MSANAASSEIVFEDFSTEWALKSEYRELCVEYLNHEKVSITKC